MKKILVPLICTMLVIFNSCQKEQSESIDGTEKKDTLKFVEFNVPVGFNWSTTQTVNVNIKITGNSGNALKNVPVKIYKKTGTDDLVLNSSSILFNGITDNNGELITMITLPSYEDSVLVCPSYIGVVNRVMVPIQANNVKCTINTDAATKKSLKTTGFASSLNGYETLGTWNQLGVPDYLMNPGDVLSSSFLSDLNASLPEGKSLVKTHPQYLKSTNQTNIVLSKEGEVELTFVHEGAGYKNIFGFYTYTLGNEPKTVSDIKNLTIIFPNSSYQGSGGGLKSGNKVKLGKFPANTVIGWFVAANGWNGTTVTDGLAKYFSNSALNPETLDSLKQHTVLLYDNKTERYVIGMEDLNRQKNSDNDFNDIVFFTTVSPNDAVVRNDVPILDTPKDTDGDGVSDNFDEYPTDNTKAFNNYYNGTLIFEDLWPSKGDYDFEDLVTGYNINQITNGANQVVEIINKIHVRAIGAGFKNGIAIQYPFASENIKSVSGSKIFNNIVKLSENGTEAGQQKAVMIVTDDVYKATTNSTKFLNVYKNVPYILTDTIVVSIVLNNALKITETGLPPYNPFLIVNQKREQEVHLPGYLPTDLVNPTYFGRSDDNTSVANGVYYLTKTNHPWALHFLQDFDYVYEGVLISNAYLKYVSWASSGGVVDKDWYVNKVGYRVDNLIYKKP